MLSLRVASLLAATITTGLVAGVFGLYSHSIMPGLGKTDDRTFVGAFQSIDRAIINPWFMLTFIGALLFTALAGLLHLGQGARPVLPWILAALVLYLVAVIITMAIHLPLNDAVKAAGVPDQISDLAEVRRRFDEARWARWNLVRAVTSVLAFGSLCWALVGCGKAL
jgi:uncharacterized membrane protein